MSYPPPPPPGQQPPQQPPYGYGYGYGYGGYPPQPQWTPPPQIDRKLLRPSTIWYWVSPIPALIGTVLAIVLLVDVIQQFDTGMDNFRTPGSVQVTMDRDDEKGIYIQTAGAPGARSASSATLSCRVRDARERPVPLKDASGFTLTVNSDEYVEQWRFVAPADGTYSVGCFEPTGVPAAVGPHIAVRRFLGPILGMVFAFLVGIGASVLIAVVTAVRRSTHKQRLQREALDARS